VRWLPLLEWIECFDEFFKGHVSTANSDDESLLFIFDQNFFLAICVNAWSFPDKQHFSPVDNLFLRLGQAIQQGQRWSGNAVDNISKLFIDLVARYRLINHVDAGQIISIVKYPLQLLITIIHLAQSLLQQRYFEILLIFLLLKMLVHFGELFWHLLFFCC